MLRKQNKTNKAGEWQHRGGDKDSSWGMAGVEKAVGTESTSDPLLRSGEVVGAKPVKRGSLPSSTGVISGLQGQAPARPQSSVTGGGMSCSWKFSFWKMLLKAGPLWEPLNGLQLSLLRFWESSVRRASCKGGDTHQLRLVEQRVWGGGGS